MITILAPQELVGMIMGLWFVSIGLGEKLASVIANYAAIPKNIRLIPAMDKIYGHAFFQFMLISLGCAAIAAIFIPILNKLIANKKEKAITATVIQHVK